MITVDIDPPFERRELIANPLLVSVLKAAFEDDVVLGASTRAGTPKRILANPSERPTPPAGASTGMLTLFRAATQKERGETPLACHRRCLRMNDTERACQHPQSDKAHRFENAYSEVLAEDLQGCCAALAWPLSWTKTTRCSLG